MFDDPFAGQADSTMSPATRCFAVTPSDSADLPQATKALYVGTAGDVVLLSIDSAASVAFRNVPAGSILDVRARAVRATGTTAADIVGLA
jgi:hypothetical protein